MAARRKTAAFRPGIVPLLVCGITAIGCNNTGVAGTLTATVDGTPRDFGHSMTLRNLQPGILVSGFADDGSGYELLVVAPTDSPAGTYACDQASTDRNVVLTDPSGTKHIAIDGGTCTFTVTDPEGDGNTTVAFHFEATLPSGASTIPVSGDVEVTGAP